jgi:23S rRNA G2445 N2-methylase RlmL
MNRIFVITTRGLEAVSADELSAISGVEVLGSAYRRVLAAASALAPLAALRTVDDAFLLLDRWTDISHTRAALAGFTDAAAGLDAGVIRAALDALRGLRPLPERPVYSVTANFVGQRNYSAPEIKTALAAGIAARCPDWTLSERDEDADLNLRLFIDHSDALLGLRISRDPLHRRPYKQHHLPGSLKPPVAAALIRLAGDVAPGACLLDPFCGSGTLLIEAALSGLRPVGGDASGEAVAHALANARDARTALLVSQWDARALPLPAASVDLAVSNLPWGRQVTVDSALRDLYARSFDALRRVCRGPLVLLTTGADLLPAPPDQRLEISLFGQTPEILIYAPD